MSFVKGTEYLFIGNIQLVNSTTPNNIPKTVNGHFILGKFLNYIEFPYHGDIYPEARAKFENGTVDSGHYHNVKETEVVNKKLL
jgi:hypothetical protein